jgi:hypothetical protein
LDRSSGRGEPAEDVADDATDAPGAVEIAAAGEQPDRQLRAPRLPTRFSIPRHVILSHAHQNTDFARKLQGDLEARGIPIWVDDAHLQPGTPMFEKAIRDALKDSFAVVLIASGYAHQSPYVHGELTKAKGLGLTIYPVWAAGRSWADSVPLEFVSAQYIDCRGRSYEVGLERLVGKLREEMLIRIPRMAVAALPSGNASVLLRWPSVPKDFLTIAIPRANLLVAVRPAVYPSLQTFLDDLHAQHLHPYYGPNTYGTNWMLRSRATALSDIHQLLAPWAWMQHQYQTSQAPIWTIDAAWGEGEPRARGLNPQTTWEVTESWDHVLGLATSSD